MSYYVTFTWPKIFLKLKFFPDISFKGVYLVQVENMAWTSEYNRLPSVIGVPEIDRKLCLYDTTLRDGEQTVGVSFNSKQKLEIARLLEEVGVERIEAGMPVSSEEDFKAIQMIVNEVKNSEIWGFCRCVKADIDAARDAGVKSVICEIPTSPYKMKAYSFTREKVFKSLVEHLKYAKSLGLRVAFFAVDATRTPLEDLKEAYQSAVNEGGAEEVVLVDTLGVATPETMMYLTKQVKEWVKVPVMVHCHNDFGMATACSLAAARAGAEYIHVTVNGIGEKSGNTDIAELAIAGSLLYGFKISLDFSKLRIISKRVAEISKVPLSPLKPVTGDNVFKRESGVVIAQIVNYPPAAEGYAPELVGAEREILLGKKSGKASIRYMLEKYSILLEEEEKVEKILQEVKKLGVKKSGTVTEQEFLSIVKDLI
ncbi:MAG: hypothetical protein AB1523_06095 [Bacillota bacterium]